MEDSERAQIERLLGENFDLKRLYQQHQEYEERLRTLGRQPYLTAQEEQEERELKQRKLKGVEKMLGFITTQAQKEKSR